MAEDQYKRGGPEDREDAENCGLDPQEMDSDLSPPLPPDGGYGWIIMFASFICNFIVDGVCFSFGIFYLEFLQYYGESKGKTAWVGSVLNGMYLSMGPITSALANKFGCRTVTIAGSVLACSAYILSTFSPNVTVLIVTYGGLGGMGFGLMYLPAIVMVGFYFEKRRALATGVAVCGSGIGAFVFAPMCEKLLSIYDWKGATWIIAGITLHGVLMGALFRPLEANHNKTLKESIKEESPLDNNLNDTKSKKNEDVSPHYKSKRVQSNTSNAKESNYVLKNRLKISATGVPNSQSPNGDVKGVTALQSLQNLASFSRSGDSGHSCPASFSMDDLYLQQQKASSAETKDRKVKDLSRPLYRKDIFYSGSIMNLPEFRSKQNLESYVRSVTSIPPDDGSSEKTGPVWKFLCMFKSLRDTLHEMMDFSLLLHPVFAVYGLSCFLCMTGFFVPFIYLPDHALEEGLSREQGAFLLSIIGIANTVARVLVGWVSDQSWADCLLINNCALILGGVATCLCPYCFSYGLLATYAAVFGSSIAVFVSLRSIIMVELMGLERLTNAFGLVTMCQGLSSFIGAPIAGSLYDATGDYSVSFYVAGCCLGLAGVICLPLRRIARWHESHSGKKVLSDIHEIQMLMADDTGTATKV